MVGGCRLRPQREALIRPRSNRALVTEKTLVTRELSPADDGEAET